MAHKAIGIIKLLIFVSGVVLLVPGMILISLINFIDLPGADEYRSKGYREF